MTPSQPSLQARSHGFGVRRAARRVQRRREAASAFEHGATLVERQRRQVAAVEPQDVEDVVRDALLCPR